MPARTPVIVGVGQVNDRPATPDAGLDSLELMVAALRAADADAGGGWLGGIDALSVVDQISFPGLGDLTAPIAAAFGARPQIAETSAYASGDSPIRFLNLAANRIASGAITSAAIVGGEALRTAMQRAAAGGERPDATRAVAAAHAPALRRRYGLVAPTEIYPLYENACRAAWGQTLAEGQAESGEMWALMSQVAAVNPNGWLRQAVESQAIVNASESNRPIAFPYTKLMVANASVNQGAGFIVTSLANARKHDVAEDRLVHIGRGAAAHEPADILARDRYYRSPAMEVVLRRALERNALTAADLDCTELYSCFPCVPKMARRIIGWPVDRPATVVGGLTFGGGPIGNYMSHAVAAMVERLRGGGRYGLLFANGGYATANHAIVLGRAAFPDAAHPYDFDVQAEADARRGPVPPLIADYAGPATVETYTAFYDRTGGLHSGVIVARTADGGRSLAHVAEAAGLAWLTDGQREPVGARGTIIADGDGLAHWHMPN